MKTQDLRIGNLVLNTSYNSIEEVVEIGQLTIRTKESGTHIEIKYYKPISIIEEWLIKLGAQQHEARKDMFNLFGYTLVITEDKDVLIVKGNLICEIRLTHLKYVHQLQNLIHSLTGSELTIKELAK